MVVIVIATYDRNFALRVDHAKSVIGTFSILIWLANSEPFKVQTKIRGNFKNHKRNY